MADLADVENSILALVTQAAYPDGTGSPSVANAKCQAYRGWPISANLDEDLAAGTINISIYPLPTEKNTTRYEEVWQELPVTSPALTLTVSGQTITVGGTPSSPLNAAVFVDGTVYVYPVQPSDTLTSIATGLAALIEAPYTTENLASDYTDEFQDPYVSAALATSVGPVITIPGAIKLYARVGAVGTLVKEIRRQKRGFQITFWCPNPASRDVVAPPVDVALANTHFLTLPDGTAGRLTYDRTTVSDRVEREGLYRRDLFYSVEYGTTTSQAVAQIIAEIINISGGTDPAVIETITI